LIIEPLPLAGAFVLNIEPRQDERGFFARTFCVEEFGRLGLKAEFLQNSMSFNARRGTLRGLHFQTPPHEETKIVRCTRGAAYDVIVDLRADSPTYCRWAAVEISQDNHRMVYIPEGFAHGFKTLADATMIEYQISAIYEPAAVAGVRWDDPSFAIDWPVTPELLIADRDASYSPFGV
jgi:dTDP-4-dehydrorhamnose 3,5-epimerase